jgi:hypothetical protein
MAGNNVFQKATKKKLKLRLAIDGPSGAGKTYTALVAATALARGGKIAVIDTERGSASLYSDKFEFDVLELDKYSPLAYINAINAAEENGYDVIVIDSLSHAWEGEGGALDLQDQASKKQGNNSYTAWREVTPLHRKLVDAILQSTAHIIATMRSKMEYVQEKNDQGRTVIRKVGLAPIQRAGMEYEFTVVADMDVEHNFITSKSRCDAFADIVEKKPSSKTFKILIDWLDSGVEATNQPKPTVSQTVNEKEIEAEKNAPMTIEKMKEFNLAICKKYTSKNVTLMAILGNYTVPANNPNNMTSTDEITNLYAQLVDFDTAQQTIKTQGEN